MGQWKSKPVPHEHDMPRPRALGQEGALKGWIWTCVDGLDFELIEYQTGTDAYSRWKDLANGQIIEQRPPRT